MHLQAGLDAIPEIVQQFHEDDEYGLVSVKPRPGICYGFHWEQLLDIFASICQEPPKFENADLIGIPFYSMVVDLLNNEHGRAFFSIPEVNKHLKRIFDTYGEMLDSPESLKHVNGEEGGWLCPEALKRVDYNEFVCDPTAPNFGFKSWHDWFTRELKEGARPMNDDDNEIVNNSESFPFSPPAHNVQWKDKFWLKDHRYSLAEMFNVSSQPEEEQRYFKEHFVGGTVYQGFLTPWCYHRWRAPVTGVVEKCYSTGNTYFVSSPTLDPKIASPLVASQALLSMISARQVYVIKADNPKVGHVCVIEIGMAEVSGVKNLVKEGQRVNKGDLLGYFRFGGSSHVIIFGNKAANLRFNESIYERKFNPTTGTSSSLLQKVCSPLAWVS